MRPERRMDPGVPPGRGWALAWLRSAGVWHGKGIGVGLGVLNPFACRGG